MDKRIVKRVEFAIVGGKFHVRCYDQHGRRFIERDRVFHTKALAERYADEIIGR